ncbi:unnamed protein product [Cylindrotheca closterium]|uniref:Carbohydrate sulfotransferase n=1 Tax=Cylindrotheca closterium TaxID=2856 RepID=A0AAD2JKF2_9STRA|nr:unnamed protein product [Cylindrotheca closterium]
MDRSQKSYYLLLLLTVGNVVFMLYNLSSTFSSEYAETSIEGMSKMKKKHMIRPHDMKKMFIYNTHSWDAAPIVVEEYKLIFFAVGKVSCTVFKQLLRRMMDLDDWREDSGPLPHNPNKNGLKYLYHYPPGKALEMLTSTNKGWSRAIFVRDPLERLLSAYLDKGKRKNGSYMAKHCNKEHQVDFSFEEFVGIVSSSCKHDPHWAPQIQRIDAPFWQHINFVGKFDTLQSDTKKLLNRVGAWEDFGESGWGPNSNETIFSKATHARHETGASGHLEEYYNSSWVRKTALQFYGKDYACPWFKFRKQIVEYR